MKIHFDFSSVKILIMLKSEHFYIHFFFFFLLYMGLNMTHGDHILQRKIILSSFNVNSDKPYIYINETNNDHCYL